MLTKNRETCQQNETPSSSGGGN